jgi:hypothetical protein
MNRNSIETCAVKGEYKIVELSVENRRKIKRRFASRVSSQVLHPDLYRGRSVHNMKSIEQLAECMKVQYAAVQRATQDCQSCRAVRHSLRRLIALPANAVERDVWLNTTILFGDMMRVLDRAIEIVSDE